uniref:Uncharacterized protein n=1 Tax=Clastoptera arizonana TaxID=38151 RepID=A0A1B6CI17_9HEMI
MANNSSLTYPKVVVPYVENDDFHLWVSNFEPKSRLNVIEKSILQILKNKGVESKEKLITSLRQLSENPRVYLRRIDEVPGISINKANEVSNSETNESFTTKKKFCGNRNQTKRKIIKKRKISNANEGMNKKIKQNTLKTERGYNICSIEEKPSIGITSYPPLKKFKSSIKVLDKNNKKDRFVQKFNKKCVSYEFKVEDIRKKNKKCKTELEKNISLRKNKVDVNKCERKNMSNQPLEEFCGNNNDHHEDNNFESKGIDFSRQEKDSGTELDKSKERSIFIQPLEKCTGNNLDKCERLDESHIRNWDCENVNVVTEKISSLKKENESDSISVAHKVNEKESSNSNNCGNDKNNGINIQLEQTISFRHEDDNKIEFHTSNKSSVFGIKWGQFIKEKISILKEYDSVSIPDANKVNEKSVVRKLHEKGDTGINVVKRNDVEKFKGFESTTLSHNCSFEKQNKKESVDDVEKHKTILKEASLRSTKTARLGLSPVRSTSCNGNSINQNQAGQTSYEKRTFWIRGTQLGNHRYHNLHLATSQNSCTMSNVQNTSTETSPMGVSPNNISKIASKSCSGNMVIAQNDVKGSVITNYESNNSRQAQNSRSVSNLQNTSTETSSIQSSPLGVSPNNISKMASKSDSGNLVIAQNYVNGSVTTNFESNNSRQTQNSRSVSNLQNTSTETLLIENSPMGVSPNNISKKASKSGSGNMALAQNDVKGRKSVISAPISSSCSKTNHNSLLDSSFTVSKFGSCREGLRTYRNLRLKTNCEKKNAREEFVPREKQHPIGDRFK